jgi:two-component system sensor histidine kinase/response regulator
LLDGDEEAAAEIIAEFLDDASRQIAALGRAVASGDQSLVLQHAHALKGASANVGAKTLRRLSAQLEEQAGGGTLDGVVDLSRGLQTELVRLGETVKARG